ncbi:hypothetical protein E1A91_D02G248500v1 [Gossypium mustelinum]|uniref:Uncharacterized protein n=1 Tax=Gossypium mustelinum TaxID=34275 RepID=A0A5D2W0C6_GOSMU|nr:hypothetical protein E1A91_D02G248500v1 [Gossypium mustelinum]
MACCLGLGCWAWTGLLLFFLLLFFRACCLLWWPAKLLVPGRVTGGRVGSGQFDPTVKIFPSFSFPFLLPFSSFFFLSFLFFFGNPDGAPRPGATVDGGARWRSPLLLPFSFSSFSFSSFVFLFYFCLLLASCSLFFCFLVVVCFSRCRRWECCGGGHGGVGAMAGDVLLFVAVEQSWPREATGAGLLVAAI